MGSEFTFYDYVSEGNVIHAWLNGLPDKAKVKFNARLRYLEATRPGDWKRPFVDTLTKGHCAGLLEIRVRLSHVQYRLLGCHGSRERRPTLLHGFIKPGSKVPEIDCREAQNRKSQVVTDPDHQREAHNYG